jgi:fibronectin-binding autotransporter adhesin
MLAIAPAVAMFAAMPAMGANLTWDPLLNGNGSDGNGNWNLSTAEWAAPGDIVWPNDTSTANFGSGGTAGVVTITAANINAGGLTFNSGYTIGANVGSTLTLTGTTNTISVVSGSATINAPIAGTTGMTITAASGSSLTLGGVNTYTGTTAVNGSVILSAGSNFGGSSLVLGTSNTATVANMTINSNVTVAGISSATNGANTLVLNNNATLTSTGAFTLSYSSTTTSNFNTSLTVNTDGSNTTLNLSPTNNGNFDIGGHSAFSGSTAANDVGYLNVASVTNFIYNTGATGTGNFYVGYGTRSDGVFIGATNNSITAATVDVGDSNGDAGNLNAAPSASNLSLGSGNNTINAAQIMVGNGKEGGILTFASGSGNLTIAGQAGGSSTATILVGNAAISGGNNTVGSTLALAGHNVTIQAGKLSVANFTSAGSNSTCPGNVTFDMGTFNVANLIMTDIASGSTNNAAGVNSNITIGTSASSTGVFSVSSGFVLLDNVSNVNANAFATFTINGGTVNVGSAITRVGQGTATLNLNAGTLNMNNNPIGAAGGGASALTTVNLANNGVPATLQSLGGTGINDAGLTVNGSGTLILAGNNTYTGGTTINTTLQVGSATQSGNLPSGGAVINNNSLTFAGSGTSLIGNLSGGGSITSNAGVALVGDSSTNYGGPVTIAGGTFGGVGTIGSVTLNSGTLQAGGSPTDVSGVLNIGTLNVSGGSLGFNLGATASSISVGSMNAVPALTFSVIGSVVSGTHYTVLTDASTLPAATFAPVNVGRSTVTAVELGNTIIATVTGTGPANLIYTNASGNGRFDVQTSKNFNNGGASDYFYQLDSVTFNDTNTGSHNVNIASAVTPTSLTVTTASNYTFSGTGSIGGTTGLTINGGTVVLGNTGGNTYSGNTTVNSGTLQLAAAGALPTGSKMLLAGTSTLDLNGNAATVGALSGTGTVRNSSTTAAATFTYAGTGAAEFDGTLSTTAGAQPLSVTIASGNLTVTGTNSYAGPTTIAGNAGLQLGTGGTGGSLSSTTAIANSGTLTYDLSSSTVTIPNTITGTGQIVQSGPGALIFTGSTSFGGLAVNSGSIQFGTGGAVAVSGAGAITNNGAIVLDSSSNLTISSVITGTGTVTQSGSGTVTLTGSGTAANSGYSGGAIVSNGTLIVSSANGFSSLGSGNTTVGAGATLVGGGQDAFGYYGANGSPGTININGGTVTDKAGGTYRITLPNLVFTGGTLTSAANATNSNGTFSLQGPQTQVTYASGPATITTNPANTTAVISANGVSIEDPLTLNIAPGTTPSGVDLLITSVLENYTTIVQPVTVNGPGVLALDANNTFTGGITVNSGTLQVGTASDTVALTTPLGAATGAVINNSLITFASSQTVTVANAISGTGAVTINSGTVLLNGSSNYSGDTTLNGGTIGGTGLISGNLVAGSGPHTIHPGPGGGVTGTFFVGGNVTTNSNTTLAFDLSSPGSPNDLLAVTGNVSLNGGKLSIASQAALGAGSLGYYEVISYSGALTGTTHGIVLPAVANNVEYTLDTAKTPGVIYVHRGFIGDTDDSGTVDVNDLNIVLANLGTTTSSWSQGNFDGAATVDLTDLNDVLNNIGTSIASSSTVVGVTSTPEPASLGILALGAAALIARRRKA